MVKAALEPRERCARVVPDFRCLNAGNPQLPPVSDNANNVVSLSAGEDIVVPKGAVHRLENRTDQPVEVIEIQTGKALGDGDLVRIEDAYGRKTTDPVQIKSAA